MSRKEYLNKVNYMDVLIPRKQLEKLLIEAELRGINKAIDALRQYDDEMESYGEFFASYLETNKEEILK
jgi:hypothetical protein